MNLPHPIIRRQRKSLLPVETMPTVCPHCGRSSAEPVKPMVETPPEKIIPPDHAESTSTTEV
jgi:hypothetical protein